MTIQRVSSHTHSSSSWKYDVFLSFRGEDTRKNFTDHLYAALDREGIKVFKDDKELERGKPISPELLQAIEQSRFSIVVFSRNYASSTWCLDELFKIIECMSTMEQTVLPVFYDVDPSMVRKQTGNFEEAFAKHEETLRDNIEKVEAWRRALKKVTDISGWDAKGRHESDFIQAIVKEISSKLILRTCMNFKDLVAIDSRLEKLRLLIGEDSCEVRMIGICGIGGIGKTTIARVVYHLISSQFEGSSFLANVREIYEKGDIISLQKQLLSQILKGINFEIWDVDNGISEIRKRLQQKKVLVVIDDVAHVNQLNKLAGAHDWFGSGSRIIITTRDKKILTMHGVNEVYEAETLNHNDALRLFSLKAFKNNQPSKDHMELSKHFVNYAGGLPLALEILGSFLFDRPISEWINELERLDKDSEKQILDVLQISFDGLKDIEKKIFLDVACFFKGYSRDYVTSILDGCGFSSTIGISILIEKSLISILEDNTLWMHDLLQQMGQQIVKRESNEPGKRSRLWDETDIHHVLTKNTGTKRVEGIVLETKLHFIVSARAFSKMINLRLLKIKNVQLLEGIEYLSNELRLLEWHGYPLKSLPSSLELNKLVELKMHFSHIEQLWKGVQPLNMLKFIILEDCPNLNEIPDLTWATNLEKFHISGCPKLRGIYSPFLVHKKLIHLKVSNCISLTTLPSKIHMESLEKIEISGCPKMKKFPEIGGSMKRLRYILIDQTTIKDIPLSIELLVGLEELILTNNNNLVTLPSTVSGLRSLKSLNLTGCSNLENVPETLGQVESLEKLDLSETSIIQPMSSIFSMRNLKELYFGGCKGPSSKSWGLHFLTNLMPKRSSNSMALILPSSSSLFSLTTLDLSDCNLGEGALPCDFFSSLFSLQRLNLSKNNFVSLPASINCLSKLWGLYLNDCKRLQSLPELPSSTFYVNVNGCASLEISSNALKSGNLELLILKCVNCLKLFDGSSLVFSMLKNFLTAAQNKKYMFSMVVPGSEIPKWLRHQSEGSTITIERPADLHNNKLVGYVVCCVFDVRKHLPILYTKDEFRTHELLCRVKTDGKSYGGALTDYNEKLGHALSKHLWLLFWHHMIPHNQIHFSFNEFLENTGFVVSRCEASRCEVSRCGVHPIYDKDLKEFNPIVDVATTKRIVALNDDDDDEEHNLKDLNNNK